jgi:nitroimidazol reductase NimA-like FMN-containing flavoprotein (pyridoxamine 5'-phosphate oxidase superfamily)
MTVTRATGRVGGQGEPKDLPAQEFCAPRRAHGRNLRALGPEECLALLEPGGVGRVGLMSPEGIVMLPVNYAIVAKTVVLRTAPDTLLAAHASEQVSFEADSLDEAAREGWSVLVQGHARKIASEREVQRLEQEAGLEPWASGARDVWVRITPARITGRRIHQAQPAVGGTRPPEGQRSG